MKDSNLERLVTMNDGLTINSSNNQVINEGFKEVSPFLDDNQTEQKIKDTSVKILLEDIKTKKQQNAYNFRKAVK